MDEVNLPPTQKGTGTAWVDFAMIGLVVVVILMALSGATRPLAIGVGIGVPWLVGLVMFILSGIDAFAKRDVSTGDKDFSSFGPEQERMFVVQEKRMRAASSRANLLGFGTAGALFVIGMGITLGMYTPCTQFCDHAPPTCKESQLAQWKSNCPAACSRLESTGGLQMLKAKSPDNPKDTAMMAASGTEFVEALSACSFSGGLGNVCEEVTKKAETFGLWCPDTNK